MQLHYFEEFVTFAKYLNFTHAANELHMTQSGLSKHIKQLEAELGFKLLTHKNGHIALTNAGSRFLSSIPSVLESLNNVICECRILSYQTPFDFLALQPTYADQSSVSYYALLQKIRAINPLAHVLYINSSRNNLEWALKNNRLHLSIAYDFGELDQIIHNYQQEGFVCKHLASESVAVWVDKNSYLNKQSIEVRDLDKATILTPNDSCFLMNKPINQLCQLYSISPKIEIANTNSQAEFLSLNDPNGVYLYPSSLFTNSLVVQAIDNRVIVPFSEDLIIHSFAIAYPSDSEEARLACRLLIDEE